MTCVRSRRITVFGVVLTGFVFAGGCADPGERARIPTRQDAMAMLRLISDSDRLLEALAADPTFTRESLDEPLTTDERNRTLPEFATFVDHDLALHSYRSLFMDAWLDIKDQKLQVYALAMGAGAHAAQLRARLRLINLIGNSTAIRTSLNDASPEHGYGGGHIDRVMIESARPDTIMLLNAAINVLTERRSRLTASPKSPKDANAAWQAARVKKKFDKLGKPPPPEVTAALAELDIEGVFVGLIPKITDFALEVGGAYHKVSGKLLNETITTMVGNELQGVISPIITDIALWLGDARLRATDSHLISEALLDSVVPQLQGGDIILERRNWYLSNLGLPGFWPHAALYVGSPTELAAAFDSDADVKKRFTNGLSSYLEETYPTAWAAYVQSHDDGPSRVIEAVSEGVVFTSLHHSCLADYVAFLRPRRTAAERAVAIAQAFSHWGKPYDFDFDSQTTSALVCSELVATAWDLPSDQGQSVTFELAEVMGRLTLPPNDMIEQFDKSYGTAEQQLDFVVFLDGNEATQSASLADVDELRASWMRPKWDLSQE